MSASIEQIIEESVLRKLRSFSLEHKKEVLDFVEFLAQRSGNAGPAQSRRSLKDLWADLGI